VKEAVYKVISENASVFWTCKHCTHERKDLTLKTKQALECFSELAVTLETLKLTVQKHDKLLNDKKSERTYASRAKPSSQNHNKGNNNNVNNNTSSLKGDQKRPPPYVNNNKNQNVILNRKESDDININSELNGDNMDEDTGFTPVVTRKTKSRDKVIGTGTSGSETTCTLQAVARRAHLHVWRLERATTQESLREYLENALDTKNVVVESLQTKGDYSSFKVSVDFDLMGKMYEPQLWPKGTSVARFRFLRTKPADSSTVE
jgi:hypothetical protein